jgi:hypothetical protein
MLQTLSSSFWLQSNHLFCPFGLVPWNNRDVVFLVYFLSKATESEKHLHVRLLY